MKVYKSIVYLKQNKVLSFPENNNNNKEKKKKKRVRSIMLRLANCEQIQV